MGGFFHIKSIGRKRRLFEDFYHRILGISWSAYFGLIVLSFLAANAVFASLYLLEHGSIAGAHDTFVDAFFFSVQSLATIGYGAMAPATLYGHILVTIEALCGLLGFALITGITFSKFARPTARVLFSNKVVVGDRNGARFVMFRLANERQNQIVEATLRVIVLQNTTTKEGEFLRVPREVKLVRDRTAFFRLTWTAAHEIDESSPFYGEDCLKRLRETESEIYLSLQGLDETIAQTVHARHAYTLDDIEWNARFKDVIAILPDGTRQIDYRDFHETVPQSPQDPPREAAALIESYPSDGAFDEDVDSEEPDAVIDDTDRLQGQPLETESAG